MSLVHLKIRDENDEGMDLVLVDNILMPANAIKMGFVDKLPIMKALKTRDDQIFICNYLKTGTHWVSNLLFYIQSTEPVESVVYPTTFLTEMFVTKETGPSTIPRIIASHLRYSRLPQHFVENNGKIVFVLRNPKDTAVSMYHFLKSQKVANNKQSWSSFLTCFLAGKVPFDSYFDYLDAWQDIIEEKKHGNILVVYYENLKKNGLSELKQIQEFLGVSNTDERLLQILERCSLQNLKSDVDTGKVKSMLVNEEGKSILYRKGEIGDWKNHLTVAQNELFDKVIKERLRKSMFTFQYE